MAPPLKGDAMAIGADFRPAWRQGNVLWWLARDL